MNSGLLHKPPVSDCLLPFSEIFIFTDKNWRILSCQVDGYVHPQYTGRFIWDCLPAEGPAGDRLRRALEGGEAVSFQECLPGVGRWVQFAMHGFENRISLHLRDLTPEKEAERVRLADEERLNQILDLASGIAWEFDPATGQVCWHGNKLAKLLKYDERTDPVLNWEQSVHPEDLPGVQLRFTQALYSGASSYAGRYRLRDHEGNYLYMSDRACIFRDGSGAPVRVVGFTEDVTLQHEYEAAMAEAKNSLQQAFDCGPESKLIYDPGSSRILAVNEAAVKQYGYTREAFLQMSLDELYAPAGLSLSWFCDEPQQQDLEIHCRKDGSLLVVKTAKAELVYQKQQVRSLSVVDVTEEHAAELARKQLEKKLFSFLERISDCFFAVSRNWDISYLNAKAEESLALEKARVTGKNLWEVLPDGLLPAFYQECQKAMAAGVPARFEAFYPRTETWFEVNAYPTDEGLSVFFHNVNERRKREQERRENARRIRKAEENLNQVLEAMSDGFYTLDRNWNIVYMTEKLAETFGISREEQIGCNVWELYPESVELKFFDAYHRAFRERCFVSFEEYLPRFNRWVQVNAYPHEDMLAVFVKDITEQKMDKQRLEFIARATSEVIWETELGTHTCSINVEKFLSVFGYQLPHASSHREFWRSKIHPDDAPVTLAQNREAIRQGTDFYVLEYRFQKADGSWAYVKDRVYVVKDAERRPVKLIGAMQDVTAEKLGARALQQREQSYRALFDNAALPKIVYDRETLQIMDVNHAAVEKYGYSREEFERLTVLDIRPKKDKRRAKDTAARVDTRQELGLWTHIKKDGSKMQVEVCAAPIHYRERLCNISMMLDVTEKLKLQQQLTRALIERQQSITKATLEAQEKERTEIGRELHDGVNQMLTTAKLYVENSKYYPESSDMFVGRSLELLQQCIQDIRNMARSLVTPAFTEFREGLGDLVRSYEELRIFKIDCTIDADVDRLETQMQLSVYRIIQEQLNNVVKYAGASRVRVEVGRAKGAVVVLVEDDGAGFNMKKHHKGIGLNNIRARAEVFGGTMKIRTKPGEGCRLEVKMPAGKGADRAH